jgi:hypothetical protein
VYRGREGFRELLTLTAHTSGREIHTQILEIETFEDGLVRRMDVFYKDTKQVVELLAPA